ncbi:MAG: hypothetical protein WD533_02315 [Dehalococcoidia bacterium]
MQTMDRRLKLGMLLIGALAVFALVVTVTDVNPVIAMWYAAFAGALALALTAFWVRPARYALVGLLIGTVLGGGIAGLLLWNEVSGTGWEGIVRAIAIVTGAAIGAIAGALGGLLLYLRKRR